MRRTLFAVLALLFLLPLNVQAQEIDLPEYTTDQRWDRANRFGVNGIVTLIALGKDQGMTVSEIGEFTGAFYVQGWAKGPREPSAALIAFYRNHMVSPTARIEVLEASENAVTARLNRPYLLIFGDDMSHYGVTVEEYDEVMRITQGMISDWIGLDLEQRIEGDWSYLTFRKR